MDTAAMLGVSVTFNVGEVQVGVGVDVGVGAGADVGVGVSVGVNVHVSAGVGVSVGVRFGLQCGSKKHVWLGRGNRSKSQPGLQLQNQLPFCVPRDQEIYFQVQFEESESHPNLPKM